LRGAVGIDRFDNAPSPGGGFVLGVTTLDIGGNGTSSEPVGNADNGLASRRGKSDAGEPVAFAGAHRGQERPLARKSGSGGQLAGRPKPSTTIRLCFRQSKRVAAGRSKKHSTRPPVSRWANRRGGQHGGVVTDEEVAAAQKTRQIAEHMVRHVVGRAGRSRAGHD